MAAASAVSPNFSASAFASVAHLTASLAAAGPEVRGGEREEVTRRLRVARFGQHRELRGGPSCCPCAISIRPRLKRAIRNVGWLSVAR